MRLYTLEVEKSWNCHPARLRSHRKLHQHQLCPKAKPANTKTHLGKETLQCWWNPKQSRNLKILHQHRYLNRDKMHMPVLLPHWPRRQSSHTGLPVVCQCATTNWLGKGLDRLPTTTHHNVNGWRWKSNICHPSQGKKGNHQKSPSGRTDPSPIQDVR